MISARSASCFLFYGGWYSTPPGIFHRLPSIFQDYQVFSYHVFSRFTGGGAGECEVPPLLSLEWNGGEEPERSRRVVPAVEREAGGGA